jgi:hypothetical protein
MKSILFLLAFIIGTTVHGQQQQQQRLQKIDVKFYFKNAAGVITPANWQSGLFAPFKGNLFVKISSLDGSALQGEIVIIHVKDGEKGKTVTNNMANMDKSQRDYIVMRQEESVGYRNGDRIVLETPGSVYIINIK